MEPLSALLITMCGLFIKSLSASLSFLVKLSCLFCLCWSILSISILTLCKKVSRVPLSDNLSGLRGQLYLGLKGSFGSLSGFRGFFLNCNSYTVLSLCIKFLISVCRACICNCLGLGMNFSPFLSTLFCFSVRVVCIASMTKALLLVSLSMSCGSI